MNPIKRHIWKKQYLYFAALLCIQSVFAQNISFSPKITKGQGPTTFFQLVANSNLTNNSTDSLFEWAVIEINATSGWEFGMCDPNNCVTDLKVGTKEKLYFGYRKN